MATLHQQLARCMRAAKGSREPSGISEGVSTEGLWHIKFEGDVGVLETGVRADLPLDNISLQHVQVSVIQTMLPITINERTRQ